MRRWVVLFTAALVAGCGEAALPAPELTSTEEVCAESFCVAFPSGWVQVVEGDSVSFTHPDSEEAIVFVSPVDMAWLMESTGSSWPASLEAVERAYWSLLATPPLAPEQVVVSPGGWAESSGHLEGLPRWHAVFAIAGGPVAVAVTIELPAEAWRDHARAFLDGVTLLEE